ncbi:MAG: hypothetical protein IJB21_03240 [Bacilli bacterium]|nr:hypothetical protein [Bacilli bacterium]
MKVINKISEIGEAFFNLISEWILPLPGIVKGFIALVVLGLVAIGILTLLKKSFKIFGIILLAVFIIIFASAILN